MIEPIDQRPWERPVTGGPVRLAVVGAGAFAQTYVLPAIRSSKHCETTVLVSPEVETLDIKGDPERLLPESFHNGIAEDVYDAVYIATPNHLHKRIAETAVSLGKPVLCEKPLAATVESAREIRKLFDDTDLQCLVGYRVQFKPIIRALKSAICEGIIGTPIHAHSDVAFQIATEESDEWRLDATKGGGALRDVGIYPINTIRFLLDQPLKPVWSDLRTVENLGDVDIHATFTLSDGEDFRASCSASFASEPTSHLRISGTDGLLVINQPYHPSAQPDVTIITDGNKNKILPDEINEYAAEIDYFAQCVLRGEPSTPGPEEGVIDLEIIKTIEQLNSDP